MAKTEELNFKVNTDTSSAQKGASDLASEFRVMGVSLNDVKNGFRSVGSFAKKSFSTIKAGIASTGIGVFVLAVGSLVSYFTNTKRGADQLDRALTAFGATVDVLTDRFSRMGEAITLVFSGKFKEAADVAKGVFSGITDEIKKESSAMVALKKRTQELRDADNEFMIQKAATRQEIERARLIAEDETKSAQERLVNLKKALELEAKTTKRELELARERMEIQKQEMALSENSAEDEAELARLKSQVIETETASLKMRRRVVTEVNALEREMMAEEKAREKERIDMLNARKKRDEETTGGIIELPKKQAEANTQLMQVNQDVMDEIMKKGNKAMAKNASNISAITQEQVNDQLSAASGLASALQSLAGESKELAIAQAIIDTYVGANKAFAVGGPVGFIQGAAIIVSGLANVKKIMEQDVGSGGGGGGGANISAPTPATPAPEMMSGSFELSGGVKPEPVQAFVVSDDVTNNQDKLAAIRRRATI